MFLHVVEKHSMVKKLVKIDKIRGKKVFAFNGMLIGKIEDIEIDDNNWAVTEVNVKLTDDVAKLFGTSGVMKKSEVAIPINYFGPMSAESVALKEQVKDVNSLREQIETHHGLR
jgi:sporulation protein YlmC with PRC-barrel domain